MNQTLPRLSRADFLKGGVPFVMLLASACAGKSQASPAATAAPPVAPAALATIVPTATPSATGQSATAGPQVSIDNFNFTPATVTVPAGTTVTWTNHDDTPHTVTSSDKALGSPAVNSDAQFTFTFSTPGTYNYFCSIHPFMTAKVIVQ